MAQEPQINDKLSAPPEHRGVPLVPKPASPDVPNSELNHATGNAMPLGGPPAAPSAVADEVYVPRKRRDDLWKPGDKVKLVKGPAPGDIITS